MIHSAGVPSNWARSPGQDAQKFQPLEKGVSVMFSFIKTLVSKCSNYAIVAAIVGIVALSPVLLYAADPIPVEVPPHNVSFAGLVTDIADQLYPIIAAAGGLGLGIWLLRFMFKIFRPR